MEDQRMMIADDDAQTHMQVMERVSEDVKRSAVTLTPKEARYMVDLYYMIQENRKRLSNQIFAMGNSGEPHKSLAWLYKQFETLERQITIMLSRYTDAHAIGRWAKSIHGVGPIITAGLMAHIDISLCTTAGCIWRFAGLEPTVRWIGREEANKLAKETWKSLTRSGVSQEQHNINVDEGIRALALRIGKKPDRLVAGAIAMSLPRRESDEPDESIEVEAGSVEDITESGLAKAISRRPWNADLKRLCFNIGECFVKVSGNEKAFYGHLYKNRKAQEVFRNERGDFAQQAAEQLGRFSYGKSTAAYKAYIAGKLPDAHLHARAKRYAVKIFLAHFFEVWYRDFHKAAPPLPYPIAILGHAHRINPPGMEGNGTK
jgi:hypothetical protein